MDKVISAVIKAIRTSNDGGPGSGNHGHAGRPGQVGGSAPGGGSGGNEHFDQLESPKTIKLTLEKSDDGRSEAKKRIDEQRQFNFFAGYMNGIQYGQGKGHDAYYAYNYHGDVLMNNLLRKGKPRSYEQQREWKKDIEETKKHIEALTDVCKNNKLRQPAVVFRGVETPDGFAKMLGLGDLSKSEVERLVSDPKFADSLIGQTFSDPAFTSTSIDPEVPKRSHFIGPCEMEIYLPKGTEGVYGGDQARITDEHEYLLQRGTQFVITGAEVVEDNPGYSPKSYHIKMQVSVVDQVPKDIPEKYEDAFPEGRREILDVIGTGEKLSDDALAKMFPDADPDAIEALNELRGKEKSIENTERMWDILELQHEMGFVSDIQAAELEAYTFDNEDRMRQQDAFRRHRQELDKKLKEIEAGEFPDQERIHEDVKINYPNADESVIPLLIIYQAENERLEEMLKHDLENYGESILTKKKQQAVEENNRRMDYVSKNVRIAG